MVGKDPCVSLTDMANVDAKQQPLQAMLLTCLDLVDELSRRSFALAVKV
jgi:hypothetical protein